MTVLFSAQYDGKAVMARVHDLHTFIVSPPNAEVCVQDEDGEQYLVSKSEVEWLAVCEE